MSKLLPSYINEEDIQASELSPQELRDIHLDALVQRALTGNLVDPRLKKAWERQKLSPTAIRVIHLRAAGYKHREIAEIVNFSPNYVGLILASEDARVLLAAFIGHASRDVLDIKSRLKAVAGEMLESVIDTTRSTRNDKLRSDNAFKLLGMAGYGAVEEKKLTVTTAVHGDQAGRLLEALTEAMELDKDEELDSAGRYTVLATEAIGHEATAVDATEEPHINRADVDDEAAA